MDTGAGDFTQDYEGRPLTVTAGRVSVIDLGSEALRVTRGPDAGNVTVNPDGTLAVVLSDPDIRGSLSFDVEVRNGGGTRTMSVDLKAEAGPQSAGWGGGDHYMLATGEDDGAVVEPGENHRKVYVTGAKDALSLQDVAAKEGVSLKDMDAEFWADHPEYGATEAMALDAAAGMAVWNAITGRPNEPASHWLLFERGYDYEEFGDDRLRLTPREMEGESPLHPLLIGAWGEGERPALSTNIKSFQGATKNLVIQDVALNEGMTILKGENWLIDGVEFSAEGLNVQEVERFTLRDSQVIDVIREESSSPGFWDGSKNKLSGLFVSGSDGVLIESSLFDHNAWADDYREDGSLAGGQPPSKFSHNVYIQSNVRDLTFSDSITMQGASFGAQLRPGGLIEGNVFVDSNIGVLVGAGGNKSFDGHYSLMRDNVTTLGAHKDVDFQLGALAGGNTIQGKLPSLVDNIVAHLTDPEDAAGLKEKDVTNSPLTIRFGTFTDDSIVYNWVTENFRDDRRKQFDQNLPEDIPTSKLDQVTISEFMEDVLGRNVAGDGVDELSAWVRANWTDVEAASDIVDFFQQGFGIEQPKERGSATTLTFVPDPRADGVRWDNRANWSTDDLPGTASGDSVDLNGNWVNYAGTTELKALDLGAGGILTVRQGLIETADLTTGTGGALEIGLAGQFWTAGYDGSETLGITMDGGRFANTGAFTGPVEMDVSGPAEVLFATPGAGFELDGSLAVEGSGARLGFDGQGGGAARLALTAGASLDFVADAGGVASIGEFRSGHWGTQAPDVNSTIDLGAGVASLSLDLAAFRGSRDQTLISADTLTGGFGEIEVTGGKGVTLWLDYETDAMHFGTGAGGQPQLILVGSSAGEVFHAADGVRNLVEGYGSGDSVDVSALVGSGGLGGLTFVGEAGGQAALMQGKVELVRFDAGPGSVVVRDGGQSKTLTLDTSGGPLSPLPVPDPVLGPEPEPEPGPAPGSTAPVADGAFPTVEMGEHERSRVNLQKLFSDADGDRMHFTLEGAPDFVTANGQGRLIANPSNGDNGSYTFQVIATDGLNSSAPLSATIRVTDTMRAPGGPVTAPSEGGGPNEAPVIEGSLGTLEMGEHERTRTELKPFFSDPDGKYLSFSLDGAPDFVAVNGQGRMLINPSDGDNGTYTFAITASDGRDTSEPLTTTLVVADTMRAPGGPVTAPSAGGGANEAPVVEGSLGALEMGEHERTRTELKSLFSDPDGRFLSFELEDAPDFATINGQGRLILSPDDGDNGSYTFRVVASDGQDTSAPLTAKLFIADTIVPPGGPVASPSSGSGLNDAPEVGRTSGPLTMGEHERSRLELAEFFTDPEGDHLSFALEKGAPDFASINGQGRLILNPADGDDGSYSFGITATDGRSTSPVLDIDLTILDTMLAPGADEFSIA